MSRVVLLLSGPNLDLLGQRQPEIYGTATLEDHYAWSLHDALAAFDGPVVEVHLSNPNAREGWRRQSVVAPAATGTIAGFGGLGYRLALEAVAELLDR